MTSPAYGLFLTFIGLTCLSSQATANTCKTASENEILGLFAQWNDSLKSGDPHQVANLYLDDALLLPTVSKTPRQSRAARIDYFEQFLAKRPSGKLDTHHVRQSCNEATLAGLYTFDFAASGQQVAARYTFTYRWDGERWLISQHHSSLLPTY
ncbi:SgcJ/EcaC family oxidoreductase [Pseudomonas guariconensis]|uniref:SgcJ/EcaC family oxidoreductase n=1 Tax=Pseudomonas guariconensis TaxID=1288410 RepID=UPI0018A888EC|nr:SgcJ/EcaC family oxidoreductase [Pseudomonas guariconensis]MBF8756217.1 SgcJ/EcaC family oxidoreductase [Pseudomonas guariconensis]